MADKIVNTDKNNTKWKIKQKTPFVLDDNRVVIPVNKEFSFEQQLQSLMMGKQKNVIDNQTQGLFNTFLDVNKLDNDGRGTMIPFVSTLYGNFLVNPSSVSISTFQKMIQTDDTIRRCNELNIATIVASIGDYYHEDPEIQDFIRTSFGKLKDGQNGLFTKMATSHWAGFWTGSFVPEVDKDGYTYIPEIFNLPQITIQFTADQYGRTENTYQYVYNYPFAGTQNALSTSYNIASSAIAGGGNSGAFTGIDGMAALGDMDYPFRTNFLNTFGLIQLDKEHLFHVAYDRHNGGINPYGYSLLRDVHPIWLQKTLTNILYVSAMQRCANPMLIGYADAKKVVEATGQEMSINAVQLLFNALQYYTEESAIILPGAKGEMFDVQVVDYTGDFSVYEKAKAYQDASIEKAMLVPGGLFDGGSSFASATAQNSLYSRMMKSLADELQYHATNQYCKFLIQKNFSKDITNFGRFEDRLQNLDDQMKLSKIVETLTVNGYLSPAYKPHTDSVLKLMGLPELNQQEFDKLRKSVDETNAKAAANQSSSVKDTSKKTETKTASDHYKNRSVTEIN